MKYDLIETMPFDKLVETLVQYDIAVSFSISDGFIVSSDRFFVQFDSADSARRWLARNVEMLVDINLGKNLDGFYVLVDPKGIESLVALVDPEFADGKADTSSTNGLFVVTALGLADLKEAIQHLFWCDVERVSSITQEKAREAVGFDGLAEVFGVE